MFAKLRVQAFQCRLEIVVRATATFANVRTSICVRQHDSITAQQAPADKPSTGHHQNNKEKIAGPHGNCPKLLLKRNRPVVRYKASATVPTAAILPSPVANCFGKCRLPRPGCMSLPVITAELVDPPQDELPGPTDADRPLDGILIEAAPAAATFRWPKSWPMIAWYGICYMLEWLFGLASLIACLAALAAVPILNFISLGYLLEASGRVAKSGRLRDGFMDIDKFARIGSIVAGTWMWLWVPRLVSSLATDAWLIDPSGVSAMAWRIGLFVCTALVIAHILLAWYSGGRLRHFFWPFLAPFRLG